MLPAYKIMKFFGIVAMGLIVFVCGILAIHWGITFVAWSKLDSGWAQALGAIAALAVAIYLSERQHTKSMALLLRGERLSREGRLASVLAVLEEATARVTEVKNAMLGEGSYAFMYESFAADKDPIVVKQIILQTGLWGFFREPQFAELVVALDRVPAHELGHPDLVKAMFMVRKALVDFEAHIKTLPDDLDDLTKDPALLTRGAWNSATMTFSLVSTATDFFKSCMEKQFEERHRAPQS